MFKVGDLVTYNQNLSLFYKKGKDLPSPIGMVMKIEKGDWGKTITYRVFWICNHTHAGRSFGGFTLGDLVKLEKSATI